jgi:hypothetical protein
MDIGATITIDGTDYSSNVLEGATIQVGRTNVDETITPHAATVNLLHRGTSVDPNVFEIGQETRITVDKQNTAGTHLLFVGQITDVVVTRDTIQIISVSAPIVDLARQDITTGNVTGTVPEAFTTLYGLISSPSYAPAGGFYALGATSTVDVPAATDNALALLTQVAASEIEGLVNQDAGETVFFTTAEDRRTYTPDLELETDEVLVDYQVTRRRDQLVNRVAVNYDAGTWTESDTTSIADFGILTKTIDTFLDTPADAEAYAIFELARSTVPAFYLDRIGVPAHLLTPADYDVLVMAPIRSAPVATAWEDVPASTAWDDLDAFTPWETFQVGESTAGAFLLRIPELFTGLPRSYFVEGATYQIGRNTLTVDLSISESTLTRPTQRWVDVFPSIAWQNVDATQTWEDLNKEEVTV